MPTDREEDLRRLTPTQCKVLYWVCRGLQYWEIGNELGYATRTVQYHMSNIYVKLGLDRLDREARRARLFQTYCPILLEQIEDPDRDCEKLQMPEEEPVEPEETALVLVEQDEREGIIPYPRPSWEPYQEGERASRWRGLLPGCILGGLAAMVGVAAVFLVLSRMPQGLPFLGLGTPTSPVATRTVLPPAETPTLEAAAVAEASPTPTELPSPTATPSPTPTSTFTPTPTQTPAPPPTPTPLADTPFDSVLNVGETWTQNGFQLTLKDVQLTTFLGAGEVRLFFAVKNRTGTRLSATLDAKNITVVDNNGNRFPLTDCTSYAEVIQINLDPGEYDEPLICARYYIAFRGNYFDPSVFELTVLVTDWSRIQEARWRIPIYH